MSSVPIRVFFFFNDTATTEIYTLSLHDALPISLIYNLSLTGLGEMRNCVWLFIVSRPDRKSTRLNSSHTVISYAVFCLKKKNEDRYRTDRRGEPQDQLLLER